MPEQTKTLAPMRKKVSGERASGGLARLDWGQTPAIVNGGFRRNDTESARASERADVDRGERRQPGLGHQPREARLQPLLAARELRRGGRLTCAAEDLGEAALGVQLSGAPLGPPLGVPLRAAALAASCEAKREGGDTDEDSPA
jgi:hypothetical protein